MGGWGRVCAMGGYMTGVLEAYADAAHMVSLACVSGFKSIWSVRAELGGKTFDVEEGGEGDG